jgi:hypothetical protein
MAIASGIVVLTLSTIVGGIPFAVAMPFLEVLPATRMIVKCACDAILILHAAYSTYGRIATAEQIIRASQLYSSKTLRVEEVPGKPKNISRQRRVHDQVHKLIPKMPTQFYKGLQIAAISAGMESIINGNTFSLEKDISRLSLESYDSSLSFDFDDVQSWKEAAAEVSRLPQR